MYFYIFYFEGKILPKVVSWWNMILQIFWNLFGPISSSKSKDIKEIRKTEKEKG